MSDGAELVPGVDDFAELLAAHDVDATRERIAQLRGEGVGAETLYARLLAPALRRVGELWASGAINVAEEHVASATVEQLMAAVYPDLFVTRRASLDPILFATPEGERHVIGLRMVADVLEGHGFKGIFLGGDVPRAELPGALRRFAPRLVVLAAYTEESAGALRDAAAAVLETAPGMPLIAGGAGEEIRGAIGRQSQVEVVDDILEALPTAERAIWGPWQERSPG